MNRLLNILTEPLRAWHRRGFDVQSPWAYELVCDVLFEKLAYYAYDTLKSVREKFPGHERKCSHKEDERLFRIANRFSPANIIEIGSPLSACYMRSPHKDTPLYIIEDKKCPSVLEQLKMCLEEVGEVGLLHLADLDCHSERSAAKSSFRANESRSRTCSDYAECSRKTAKPTLELKSLAEEIYETAVSHISPESVLVIDGIDKKRRHLWRHITESDTRATVTFDLGRCGMVTFDPKRVKQNYLL